MLHVMMLKFGDRVRMQLVLVQVAPLILLTCLGQFTLLVLMTLLKSVLWDVTQMSWVIPSL